MNKILLNFRQLERTKKEEQTVSWRVGTRRAFPVEEEACWGQCSYKLSHRGCCKSREDVFGLLLWLFWVGGGFPPTKRFLKPLFFPYQSNHPAAKWRDRQERGCLWRNTQREPPACSASGVCTHSARSCVEWGGRKVGLYFSLYYFKQRRHKISAKLQT